MMASTNARYGECRLNIASNASRTPRAKHTAAAATIYRTAAEGSKWILGGMGRSAAYLRWSQNTMGAASAHVDRRFHFEGERTPRLRWSGLVQGYSAAGDWIPSDCNTTAIFFSAVLWICETRLSFTPSISPISRMVKSLV